MRFCTEPIRRLWTVVAWACLVAASVGAPVPEADGALQGGQARRVVWGTDLDVAMGRARSSLKPVLVLFTTQQSIACGRLKVGPLQAASVAPWLERFETVEIDAARDAELAMRLRVKSTPAFRILEPDGRLRATFDGYMGSAELAAALATAADPAANLEQAGALANRLRRGGTDTNTWVEAMRMMASPEGRALIRAAALSISTNAQPHLVACLDDRSLAVRMGALELLEEFTGDSLGYNPWDPPDLPAQRESVNRWRAWASSGQRTNLLYAVMTEDAFDRCLGDLIGGDANRSARAVRLLSEGGEVVARGIDRYLKAHPGLGEDAFRRIKEVQYSLVIPPASGLNALATAHRLIWGNLDVQIETIRRLSDCGVPALPILLDLLASPEPLVREAAAETAFAAADRFAVKPLQEHLKRERDPDVIFTILRQLGDIRTRRSIEVLQSFFRNENEDLAITAIESVTKIGDQDALRGLGPLLEDPRWRVRAAALQGIASRDQRDECAAQVIRCLNDPEPFVRHTAISKIAEFKINGAQGSLKKAYEKHPDMRAAAAGALVALECPLPDAWEDALFAGESSDLLTAIEGLREINSANREMLHRAARGDNLDAAAAALRVISNSSKRNASDNLLLIDALESGIPERELTIIEEFNVDYRDRDRVKKSLAATAVVEPVAAEAPVGAARDGARVDELMAALAGSAAPGPQKEKPAASSMRSGTDEGVLVAARSLMRTAKTESTRRNAMLLLSRFGDPEALHRAGEEWSRLTSVERTRVAPHLSKLGASGAALFRRALDGGERDVMEAAMRGLSEGESPELLEELLGQMVKDPDRLPPAMVWRNGVDDLIRRGPARRSAAVIRQHRIVGQGDEKPDPLIAAARNLLGNSHTRPDVTVFALAILICGQPDPANERKALSLIEDQSAVVRRAAWLLLARSNTPLFVERIADIRKDPAWHVRDVIPAWFNKARFSRYIDLYFSEDERLERHEGLTLESHAYRERDRPMDPRLIETLKAIGAEDPEPIVRFHTYLTLLAGHVAVDLNEVLTAARQCRDRKAVAASMAMFFSEHGDGLGRDFEVLLPLLRTPEGEEQNNYAIKEMQKRWGVQEGGPEEFPADFSFAARKALDRPVVASVTEDGDEKGGGDAGPATLIFFTTPGCKECASVERQLEWLQMVQAGLEVRTVNVRSPGGMRLYEVLGERFGVAPLQRGLTPAVFMAGGYLAKNDLNRSALMDLAARSRGHRAQAAWLATTEAELAGADSAIRQRGGSLSLPIILGAGLLDGVNPCAFATMVFLISYLRVRRRTGREIIQIGAAYVFAVFLTYVLLGLGLADLVSRLKVFGEMGRWLNRALAAGTFIAALLSLRDGVRCARGRAAEMTLQLPPRLKSGIHAAVRHGTATPRFILAALALGVTVSVLELACTGQVYLPTIMFMIQDPNTAGRAFPFLIAYNLAFVAPLVAVFTLSAAGTHSDQLRLLMMRHMAMVKFSLAALFFILFFVFMRYAAI